MSRNCRLSVAAAVSFAVAFVVLDDFHKAKWKRKRVIFLPRLVASCHLVVPAYSSKHSASHRTRTLSVMKFVTIAN